MQNPPNTPVAHSVLAAGERLPQSALRSGWDSPEIQRILFTARQRFGHALCTCRPEPLKLQIRLRDQKCHLAVWPQEHPAHDSECIFFHDEVAEGASAVAALRAAVAPATAATPAPTAAPVLPARIQLWTGPDAAGAAGAASVSIKTLAQRLWEAGSLCRWHPEWTRDWGRTRYQLLRGASEFQLNGEPLEQLLFVPRPYRESAAGALNQEWESFLRSLHVNARLGPRLLIAPVRCVNPAAEQRPATVLLRHLRGPIGLSAACYGFISRDCRNALSNSRVGTAQRSAAGMHVSAGATHHPELMGFFFVEGGSRGGVCARAGWLMAVHPSIYMPAASSNQVLLIDALVAGRYAFQHLISEVQPSRRTAPDLLVRHVRGPDGVPVARAALEVLAPSVSSEFMQTRAAIAERMREQGIPTWIWTPAGPAGERRVPTLPPQDQTSPQIAAQVLQQIFDSRHADYRYGFSAKFSPHERKLP